MGAVVPASLERPKGRFILIDQTVKGPGGHHFEYAIRILDSARDRGLEAVLAAHRDYKHRGSRQALKVSRAFSRTFWDNYQYYYGGRPASQKRLKALIRVPRLGVRQRVPSLGMMRTSLEFSPTGLALARAREIGAHDIVLKPHLAQDYSPVPSSRGRLLASRVALMAGDAAGSMGRKIGALWRWRPIRMALGAAAVVPGLGLLPFTLLARPKDAAQVFAEECRKAFEELEAGPGDVVFVPNATAAELGGLALLKAARHPAAQAHWAFLFRRPIFNGYPDSYPQQNEQARVHRVHLDMLKRAAPDLDVAFYTDTDELTDQYNRLRVFPFETLPVPVEVAESGRARSTGEARALTIGYLGDARDEKGFQHLPRLVEALTAEGRAGPPVKFLLQANFNVPGGEPESRYAKHRLANYPGSLVELPEGPFDQAEYSALLARMDVIVVPYASEQYSARSSGVLAEAIASGTPAIVPSGTWMASVAEETRLRHLGRLFEAARDDVRLLDRTVVPYEAVHNKLVQFAGANYCLVKLRFASSVKRYVRIATVMINEHGVPLGTKSQTVKVIDHVATAAFAVEPDRWWSFVASPIEPTVLDKPIEAEIAIYSGPPKLPLYAGVAIFDDVTKDFARTVADVVEAWDHHKAAAERLRVEMRGLYDPGHLVDVVAARAAGRAAMAQEREHAS
jgi:hypothetical protein